MDSAHTQAQALVDAAQLKAATILAAATADGEAAAQSESRMRSARVRRQAHEAVLTTRNALRLQLQGQVRESALALRTDERYPTLLDRLTERSRMLLGPDTTVTESPDGGVIAEAGSRRVDFSLPTLAAGTLDRMAPEVDGLWSR
ncbi:hypothetical protein [Cryobacterium sp. PH29-G1]|uniref:hypothetical protein n=1 Tax=Cryobacterium sp. PH29-G1 TaxID=3046211 RepID=UPI0024B926B8|nr:hypothetical protein [Cryobacterium sp. PH29-G1]MDJ0348014.1 hypothetical protein [Cryobacterium sp. PH29-G1]